MQEMEKRGKIMHIFIAEDDLDMQKILDKMKMRYCFLFSGYR